MTHHTTLLRSLMLALTLVVLAPFAGSAGAVFGVEAAQAQTITSISVQGNQRVDTATVISYLTVRKGQAATSSAILASKESLLSSGLFSSVNVSYGGGALRVRVSENAIVASVLFEGNQRFSDQELLAMVDMASRGIYTDSRLATDEQSIRLAYEKAGYTNVGVDAKTTVMANSRVQVTFVVNEGDRAGIAAINFTGNNHFNAGQLKSVMATKESGLLSWLFRDDTYDRDKLAIDSERIRLFYANHGYPDAQVLSAVADYDNDKNAYFINFTISEGEYYSFGGVGIETSISGLDTGPLTAVVKTHEGNRYSQDYLQQTAQQMAVAATDQGYPFADVRPRVDRDIANKKFNVTYLVDQGPKVYVQRINITGNTKTRDFVIRRELGFAEGDPFNRSLVSRGKANVEKLGYFSAVNVSTERGNEPDKVIIDVAVTEKSTGEYGATAGYSTAEGVLGELSLTERNFLGRGQYLKVAVGASQSGKTFDFSFTEPRFMGLKVSTGFDIYKHVSDETSSSFYGTDATGGQVRLGVPLTNEVTTTLFAGAESKAFVDSNPDDSALIADGTTRNKAWVGYTLSYDGLDDRKNPTSGLFASLTQKYVGWDNDYLQSELKGRYFMPLGDETGFVASIKGQVGVINDLSGSGVHPTETFALGPSLVRGFEGRGFGPRLASGEALGATYYAGVSAELEFPFPVVPQSYGLSGALWGDVGYVGSESSGGPAATAGADQPLRASVGASIIWDSPFGPLRGDFAHVIQKDDADRTQVFQLTVKSLL